MSGGSDHPKFSKFAGSPPDGWKCNHPFHGNSPATSALERLMDAYLMLYSKIAMADIGDSALVAAAREEHRRLVEALRKIEDWADFSKGNGRLDRLLACQKIAQAALNPTEKKP